MGARPPPSTANMAASLGVPVAWVYAGRLCLRHIACGLSPASCWRRSISVFPTMGPRLHPDGFHTVVIVGGMGSIRRRPSWRGLFLTQVAGRSPRSTSSPVWTDPIVFGIMVVMLIGAPRKVCSGGSDMPDRADGRRPQPTTCFVGVLVPRRPRLPFAAIGAAQNDHLLFAALRTEALIFGGLAPLSVDILLGYTGLLSLGQALYFGLGAYLSALVPQGGAVVSGWRWPRGSAAGVVLGLVGGIIAIRVARRLFSR